MDEVFSSDGVSSSLFVVLVSSSYREGLDSFSCLDGVAGSSFVVSFLGEVLVLREGGVFFLRFFLPIFVSESCVDGIRSRSLLAPSRLQLCQTSCVVLEGSLGLGAAHAEWSHPIL